jgi:hypothetical protein
MKSNKWINLKASLKAALAGAAIGWLCWQTGNVGHAQTASQNMSPDLQEVVKLSQSHMGDDVIVNYIRSSGKSYRLSADDIIYLNGQGVSQGVISALQTTSAASPNPAAVVPAPMAPPSGPPPAQPVVMPAPAPQVEVSAPAAPEVNFGYFHDQLAPFGTWINVGGVMYWHPDQAIAANPDWRPYYDMGQWAQTDNGLFWQSDYTWGDIPFHYGRWILHPVYGWLWAPDYTWGPAWVFWRHAEGDACIGWAPLPVGAVFMDGFFMFNGVRVGLDFDFGLGESCFTFVGYDHFHEGFFRMRGHEWGYHIGHERLHAFYGRSVIRNEFRKDEHGRFVNNGIGHDRIEHLTHVTHSNFEERHPVGDRNQLAKQREEHAFAGNNGHPGAGNGGRSSEINSGSHVTGGGAGNAAHNESHNEAGNAGHLGAAHTDNGSVSKVFRPPTSGSSGGSNNSSHGNTGNTSNSKGNQNKK